VKGVSGWGIAQMHCVFQEEYRQVRLMEEKRLMQVVEEYRRRFDAERQRLVQALERNQQLTRTIASILPEFAAIEREVRPLPVDLSPSAAAAPMPPASAGPHEAYS